jgi:hypothetical protein
MENKKIKNNVDSVLLKKQDDTDIVRKNNQKKNPDIIARKTYKKNLPKRKIILILIVIILALLVVFGVFYFLPKNKKDEKHPLSKENKSVDLKSPGKVVEKDNLNEAFPENSQIISQGKFNDVEQHLEGKALFVKNGEDNLLRLENFKMVNGQDMHVYLSPILNLNTADAIDLGAPNATRGNMNYVLDKSINLEKYNNVLIWSNRFDAFFGYAVLQKGELPSEVTPSENRENNESLIDEQVDQSQEEQSQIKDVPAKENMGESSL